MINFQQLVNVLLEMGPKGFSKKSAIADVGLVNTDPRNNWQFNRGNVSKEERAANAEASKAMKAFYNKMSGVFSIINSKPDTKQHAENIIKDYMNLYHSLQRDRKVIIKNINYSTENPFHRKLVADREQAIERSIETMEQLEEMEGDVYSDFVNFACEIAVPVLHENEIKRVQAINAQASDEEQQTPRSTDYFDSEIRKIFNLWKDKKDRAYQENRSRAITSIRNNGYYGLSTAVTSLTTWLNNTAARLGDEERRKANNIVKYNSSRDVIGTITNIPEGQKVKRLLDIVDEVSHMFRASSEQTSKFSKAGGESMIDKLKETEEYQDKHEEALQIVSDLGVILGSGQFELFKLVQSFFDDEELSEGALKKFILDDIVKSFNS